jgi:hypothetical protein
MLTELLAPPTGVRTTRVLAALDVAASSWYRAPRDPAERKRPGPRSKPLADELVQAIVDMATRNPWYGYKRIAVMCRRAGQAVKAWRSQISNAIEPLGHRGRKLGSEKTLLGVSNG